MADSVSSPLGELKLKMWAVSRYEPETGSTIEHDLDTDTVGTGAVIRLLWALRQHIPSPPTLSDMAEQVENYLDGGGEFEKLAECISTAVEASGWYAAMKATSGRVSGKNADPTPSCVEPHSTQD